MPGLRVFELIGRALNISPDDFFHDELDGDEISAIREIETLWKEVSPG